MGAGGASRAVARAEGVAEQRHVGDRGSAVVEFVTLGVLLLIPLVYLVTVLARVQAAGYAADGSARAAARVFAAAPDEPRGRRAALTAVRLGLLDQGFDVPAADALSLACSERPCLRPGGRVVAQVEVVVRLPGVPALVDRVAPARVVVRGTQTATVDEFRAEGGQR